MSQAFPVSRLCASEAHLGASSFDFDGRSFDWSAVAFDASERRPYKLPPATQLYILVLSAIGSWGLLCLAMVLVGF